MSHVNVSIDGKQYRMACEDGEEEHLRLLGEDFDRRIGELRGSFGEIGDMRLAVMAALMVADELSDATERLQQAEAQLAAARQLGEAAADRAQATQYAVATALNAASERIEGVTRSLNQSLTAAVPVG